MAVDPDFALRVAGPDDVDVVLSVLDEAAGWLWDSGVRQWPERFQPEWILPALERGETWLASRDGVPAGTFTLSWSDAAWAGSEGDAGYLHRLAVCRWAAGLGAVLLDHVEEMVLVHGPSVVRLDCVASNDALRRYYERAGFVHRGDVEVAGAPGQRLIGGGTRTVISRYELRLTR